MAKSKSHKYKPRKPRPQSNVRQTAAASPEQEPAAGGNRQARRAAARGKASQPEPVVTGNRQQRRTPYPQRSSSGKPMWIRILILIFVAVMLIGFILVPLLK